MKLRILFVFFLAGSFSAGAQQKLKDLLYSGKLKSESGSVIRKTDDLSTKIDTSAKKAEAAPAVDMTQPMALVTPADTVKKAPVQPAAATTNAAAKQTDPASQQTTAITVDVVDSSSITVIAPPPPPAAMKSNNTIWKEYTNGVMADLKKEISDNKKIKKETYYVTIDYDIAEGGETSVINVTSSPENAMLQALIKDRVMNNPPKVAPVPRKVKRKYNFTVTKD